MEKNLKRKNQQIFRLDDSELELVGKKMTAAKIKNKEAYYRKMVLDGYVVNVNFEDVQEMNRLLRNATNNLNQIAKRVNSDGSIFESDIKDIKDIQEHYEKLWNQSEIIFENIAKWKL